MVQSWGRQAQCPSSARPEMREHGVWTSMQINQTCFFFLRNGCNSTRSFKPQQLSAKSISNGERMYASGDNSVTRTLKIAVHTKTLILQKTEGIVWLLQTESECIAWTTYSRVRVRGTANSRSNNWKFCNEGHPSDMSESAVLLRKTTALQSCAASQTRSFSSRRSQGARKVLARRSRGTRKALKALWPFVSSPQTSSSTAKKHSV